MNATDTITTGGRTIPLPTEADLAMNLAEEWRASTDHIAAGFSGAPWNYVCGFIRRCHAAEAEVRRQAEEIESLRERVGELEAGLQPFADYSEAVSGSWPDDTTTTLTWVHQSHQKYLTLGQCRRATDLLAKGASHE